MTRHLPSASRSIDSVSRPFALFGFVFAAPVLLVMLLSMMWLPAAIGVQKAFPDKTVVNLSGDGSPYPRAQNELVPQIACGSPYSFL